MTSKSELLSAFEDVTINSSSTSLDFSWPALTTTPKSIQIEAPSLALEFLVAISMTKVVIRGYYLEAAVKPDRTVGLGSVANVLRSENFLDKEVVAMKQVRSLSKGFTIGRNDFEDHLRRLCLELRILNHKPLREHPNIIKLLGVGLHEDCGHPSLSLALEYAESGNLKVFLNGAGEDLTTHTLVDFACQAAMGLEALHQALICHGDVKTSNCLVFKENDRWRIKVSDFSESVVAEQADDSFLSLQCRFGTRFLNAPELRRAATAGFCYLDIKSAISTDVYSFGILTWETLKRGRSYLDPSWYAQGNSNLDEDDMEAFLEDLAPDGLIRFAQDYVHRTIPDLSIVKLVSRVFVGTLHAYPIERKSIKTIRGYLEAGNPEERSVTIPIRISHSLSVLSQGYLPENGAPASQQLKNWTSTRKTLLEVRFSNFTSMHWWLIHL
jgi:serine/threonine protein kinase